MRKEVTRDAALTAVERAVLDFAALRWKCQGAKETAVRDRFGWSLTRYAQVLNALLDRPAAHEYAPVLTARLLRLREARHSERRNLQT